MTKTKTETKAIKGTLFGIIAGITIGYIGHNEIKLRSHQVMRELNLTTGPSVILEKQKEQHYIKLENQSIPLVINEEGIYIGSKKYLASQVVKQGLDYNSRVLLTHYILEDILKHKNAHLDILSSLTTAHFQLDPQGTFNSIGNESIKKYCAHLMLEDTREIVNKTGKTFKKFYEGIKEAFE